MPRRKPSAEASPGDARQPWFAGGLRFVCTACGRCCTGAAGSVHVSQADLERLAGFFGLSAGAFARRYTRSVRGRRLLLNAAGSPDCIFLRDRRCSVYEARPTQCRTYPWWPAILQDEEAWREEAALCEGIENPEAPLVPATEIITQLRIDAASEAALRHELLVQ